MRVLFLLALIALVGSAVADRKVLHTRIVAPKSWASDGVADLELPLRFGLALKQRNLDVLKQKFDAVSDPKSPDWGKFLSIDEVNAIVSPSADEKAAVFAWLSSHGVAQDSIKDLGDALSITTNVRVAADLFDTIFHVFSHQETGHKVVSQIGDCSIPKSLESVVEFVEGISNFPVPHLQVKRSPPSNDNVGIVPQTAANVYNLTGAPDSTSSSQGVIEFQGQSFSPSQLQAFATAVDIPIKPVAADHIVGPNQSSAPGTESTLDIQWIAGINPGSPSWFWLESGNNWLYLFAVHFFNTKTVPYVNSISYGWNEADQCQIAGTECQTLGVNDEQYVQRVNTEFQKIGTRGISLLSASGDSGANGRTDEGCSESHLNPPFPGASPFVTTVGATQLDKPFGTLPKTPAACTDSGLTCYANGGEVAVSYDVAGFASGGGFSVFAKAESYQTDAIKAYLGSGVELPPEGYYNKVGRGFPDVAALGHNMLIDQGSIQPVGGTSASAPTFAGIMAALNDYKIKTTQSPLGFLNPFLYQAAAADPTAFNDIVTGDNKCTESGCQASCKGFVAAKGWDPVTGLGSPNYKNMLAYLQKQIAEHQALHGASA